MIIDIIIINDDTLDIEIDGYSQLWIYLKQTVSQIENVVQFATAESPDDNW